VLYVLGYSLDTCRSWRCRSPSASCRRRVVVIENIVRHLERGLSHGSGAQGSREIGFTIISITLSLIAVFIRCS